MNEEHLKLLVVGGGAREHALAWKLLRGPKVEGVYVAPGNAGTESAARNLDIPPSDLKALADAAEGLDIALTVVGPEASLDAGIVDLFQERGLPIFGPTKAATRIESSKVFARELMEKYGIPCARGAVFSSSDEAREYILSQPTPIVVKADGLAAGKGVTIAQSREEALEALSNIMEKKAFGAAGDRVIIEECLKGKEVSLIAFTDGETIIPMVPACDYKRALDNDEGPNTGGMGSYSPPGFFDKELIDRAEEIILEPAIQAMSREGRPYRGVLYAGLMVTPEGPKVLEFNARLGDPENQVIMPRLKSDLLDILLSVINGNLDEISIEWSDDACIGVVMASGGYPGSYKTGFPIVGLDSLDEDIIAFHAGTKMNEGQTVTSGGRVLTVTATGKSLAEARSKVYRNLPRIHFEGCHYRRDIAARELN